ncbi:xylosyltransferase 1-like isoform X3 [Pomacea canaliculata]|uniref:xylosyltransferase 1-like isoform X3 n=1 Tax=Pomacea canaliculata TaxID=400727 RepID=UPI000D737DEF|nr:xylosyltransferase 1-like isoform X3 [Pomacea canaliculata]
MAAARLVVTRRLYSRYKYFFYFSIVILALQALLGYSFYSMKEVDQSDDKATGNGPHVNPANDQLSNKNEPNGFADKGRHQESHSTDKLISKNGGTGPPQDHHQDADNDHGDTQLDKLENSNHDANGAEGPGVEASLATETPRFTKYQPKCEVTEKEAISAISRAKTVQCKQELADVACLHMENKLYKTYLPRFCPLRGNNTGKYLGCYKDNLSDRDLEGSYVETDENSPDMCVNYCLRAGFSYAGLQYTRECWCGDAYGKHGLREDAHCSSKCPGQENATCGGYLANRIFMTGFGKAIRHPAPLSLDSTQPQKSLVKIVFVLTLNGRQTRQVVRLLRTLYQPHHYYYIHVDSRQEYMFRELLPLEELLPNVMVTRNRFATIWGGSSLLQAHLSFLKELLDKTEWAWDYYINLSESDYPIKTISDLTSYLTTYKGLNFLKSHGKDTPRFIKKQGLDQTFYECENHLWRVGRRPLPNGIRVDGGSDWICLYRSFAQYVIKENDELLAGLKAYYKYSLLPAESFFHTVLQNSHFCTESVDNNLHMTNWRRKQGCKCQYKHIVDWCGCSPNDFKINDLERLLLVQKYEDKPLFFARKFEAVVSQEIINSLDVYLFGHLQQGMTGLSSYWQNEYHHLDYQRKSRDGRFTFYHAFMRLTLASLKQRNASCQLRPLQLLEINLFQESDHFHGLLTLFKVEDLTSGKELTLEAHMHPKHYYSVIDAKGPVGRLQYLEVGSDFDPKEQIFRNYGRLLGPFDEVALRHVWDLGKEFTVSMAWVDPANIIAASYDIKIPGSVFTGSHKPALNRPLRPGVWTVKLMYNMALVAETQFLIIPLTHYQGRLILPAQVPRTHGGPIGMYSSKDFSELRDILKVPQSRELEEEAANNAKKVGKDLELWVDSLLPLFWVMQEACSMEVSNFCALQECTKTSWSSRSPDPKSDIRSIGSKLPLGR